MRKILNIVVLALLLTACSEFEPVIFDATSQVGYGFEQTTESIIVLDGGVEYSQSVDVTLKSDTDRVINLIIDEEESILPDGNFSNMSLVIPANSYVGTFKVNFNNDGLIPFRKYPLVVKMDLPSGAAAIRKGADKLTMNIAPPYPCNDLSLIIDFDNYGSEVTWNIKDLDGAIMYSGGPYEDGDDAIELNDLTLEDGCYTFEINDSYGDGLTAPSGSYNLNCDAIYIHASGDGSHGAGEVTEFCVNP